jgi:Lrp/AsnC family transcriptional regulator, regulator for asnA, asnC and gidA
LLTEEQLDPIDRKILTILQEDARTPVAVIARQVKLGETTIRYRLNRLTEAGVISKFSAILNPRLVGYPVGAILLFKAQPKMPTKVFEEIASHQEVSHLLQTTGSYDMLAVVHTKSLAHLNELVRELKAIPGVRAAETWMTTGLLKVDLALKLN